MANQPKKYKKFVATAATATLVASAIVPVASAKSFSDVAESNEFQPFIDALSNDGIINGYADGTFKPGAKLTRGQVVKMLGRWVESNGQAVPTDWDSVQRFNDVPVNGKDQELVKYAALVKDAGVFEGSNGNLMAGNNITRQQMAKVLNGAYEAVNGVSLVELAENIDDKLIQDLSTSQQEFEGYIQALVDLEISTVSVFRPKENVTRAQFAKFLYNTINLEAVESASVKAINATTVEVTFDEAIKDIKALDFTIDGLDVKNAVVKQSDSKTAILTTAAQEAGKEYTVSVNSEEVGKFVGVSAVLPTAIDIVEKSQQNVLGNQVTVTAKVTVPEGQSAAGIPVTFNIINAQTNQQTVGSNLNPTLVEEVTTDENGVATYTYTRYASTARDLITHDEVQAYATGKATVRSFSKVYWGAIQPLAITEVTQGNNITNGGKKVYKVKLAGVSTNVTPGGNLDRVVNIGFKENVNVAPDKAVKTVKVTDANGKDLGYPGQFTTTGAVTTNNFNSVVLQLDANGEATFTLTGSNATVTPFVFKDTYANTNNTDPSQGRFDETELFAQAPALTFAKIQTLQVEVTSVGVSNASAYFESFGATDVYNYKNAAGATLIRDAAGNLTSIAAGASLPTGAVIINQYNPLRTGEVVPAGFVYTTISTATPISGVTALNNRLGTNASYIYNQTNGASLLAADLVNTGGRDYKAVIKNVDGKLATSNTPVKVKVNYGTARTATQAAPIYVIDNNSRTVYKISNFAKNPENAETYNFLTDSKGEISFTIIGGRDSYATPTVFIETGDSNGLDKNDAQHAGEIVYFGDRTITDANLTVNDKTVTSTTVSGAAKFTYQVADQNGKYYHLWNNTTSTTNSNIFETSFEVASQFSVAYVYDRPKDEVGARLLETVPQGSTRTVKVNSGAGKAEIYVYSTVGNTVTVNANASQGTYPNKTASATFTNLLNEGVETEVKGRIVAIDKDNNRILLSNSSGNTVYELKYGQSTDDLAVGGVVVTEATFEHSLRVGEELHFVQKTDTTKAKFNNFNFDSGVTLSTSNLNLILINGDQTAQPKVYDFGRYTTDGGTTLETTGNYDASGRQKITAKQLVINGDNITVQNLALTGDLVVGVPAGSSLTQPQVLNDFTINNSSVSGTTTVNRGDGNTLTVKDSTLNKVVLNIKEHIALSNSTISEIELNAGGSNITGDGTVINPVKTNGFTFSNAPTVNIPNSPDSTQGAQALKVALEKAAALKAADYTAESYKVVTDAVAAANALPATATDAEKAAAAKVIEDAIKALVLAPPSPEGLEITTFTANTANDITEALGIFTAYSVAGTVADATITSVELIYTLEDGTEVARTVTVTNGAFTDALPASTGTVKSVKAKVGTKVTADKAVTVVKPQ